MKHGTKYITVDLFQNILISEAEQMHPFFLSTVPGISPLTAHSKTQNWPDVSYREVLFSCAWAGQLWWKFYRVQSMHMPGMWSLFSPAVQLTLFHMQWKLCLTLLSGPLQIGCKVKESVKSGQWQLHVLKKLSCLVDKTLADHLKYRFLNINYVNMASCPYAYRKQLLHSVITT